MTKAYEVGERPIDEYEYLQNENVCDFCREYKSDYGYIMNMNREGGKVDICLQCTIDGCIEWCRNTVEKEVQSTIERRHSDSDQKSEFLDEIYMLGTFINSGCWSDYLHDLDIRSIAGTLPKVRSSAEREEEKG